METQDYNTILKSYLLLDLPTYMIPPEFVSFQKFPLNSNYITDKKALLELYFNRNQV